MRAAALLALAAAGLALAGCGGGSSRTSAPTAADAAPAQAAAVPELRSIAELRDHFRAHAAEPQLVLLISPT